MRLQAPIGTTQVQSPTANYALDAETCIEIPDDHPDVDLFTALGFMPAQTASPRPPRGKSATTPAPQAEGENQ